MKYLAMWSGSAECGMSDSEVDTFVDRSYNAGINTLLVHLKGGDGTVYWKSDIVPQATHPGYDVFDLPAALLIACRKRGMRLEAWLIDFFEGNGGAAHQEHPDWVMVDPDGKTTSEEMLRGSPWGPLWMCPARRPGYTDQWLVPLIKEFAQKYDFDAIHHDYVRYPGDAAPDRYCFCDYCLEHLPKWAGYISDTYPTDAFFHELYDRGYIEAHWEQGPRVLPSNWDSLPRSFKAKFLLEGGFFQGGRNDLDYFFYLYRSHWITDFCKLAKEAVREVRPEMDVSAAVFKNPIHSGRFIGQDWRTFEGYVDGIIPMNYRDHYPGSFEVYLNLLTETIGNQKKLTAGFKYYWPGAAINFLFAEEERPLAATSEELNCGDTARALASYGQIEHQVRSVSPDLASAMDVLRQNPDALDTAREKFESFRKHIPSTYWPSEKLGQLVKTIAATNVGGMALFCVGHLDQYGMWEQLAASLKEIDGNHTN
ncbi:MAG: family 10 glycosylhydrolase [Armatimonadota bacterium]|nr:family 10 glycosylhydrolase [Armatimonadota bacterium]